MRDSPLFRANFLAHFSTSTDPVLCNQAVMNLTAASTNNDIVAHQGCCDELVSMLETVWPNSLLQAAFMSGLPAAIQQECTETRSTFIHVLQDRAVAQYNVQSSKPGMATTPTAAATTQTGPAPTLPTRSPHPSHRKPRPRIGHRSRLGCRAQRPIWQTMTSDLRGLLARMGEAEVRRSRESNAFLTCATRSRSRSV